jgi:undecaprenyl-diphosphatase
MADVCPGAVDTGFVSLSYAKVAFLGLVQGVTELLPISSTAHMRIVPAVLGWTDPGAAFSAAMQLAALLAVVSYFRQDVLALVGGSWRAVRLGQYGDRTLRLSLWIGVATLPIAVAGLLLAPLLNACGSPLRSIPAIGIACVIMGLLLAVAELRARHLRTLEDASALDAVMVGLAQIGALIPGVSRSGSTLTAALGLGFKREEAARFSFLLGVPAIALAGLKEVWELHKAHLDLHGWSILAVGITVGALSAFVAIWGLMRVLERFSAWPFVIYRIALGVALLAAAATGLLK